MEGEIHTSTRANLIPKGTPRRVRPHHLERNPRHRLLLFPACLGAFICALNFYLSFLRVLSIASADAKLNTATSLASHLLVLRFFSIVCSHRMRTFT